MRVVEQHILSEGRGWRERYKARQGADLGTIFVALSYVPVSRPNPVRPGDCSDWNDIGEARDPS